MTRPVYSHNGNSYIVLDKKTIQHFCRTFTDGPDMEYVQLYMKWRGTDHVLRTDSHFLFCETIPDAEIIP